MQDSNKKTDDFKVLFNIQLMSVTYQERCYLCWRETWNCCINFTGSVCSLCQILHDTGNGKSCW